MREIKLNCDWNFPDYMTVSETESGMAVIDIDEEQQQCRAIFGQEKATQLRDWLNEFLGDPSKKSASSEMYDMLASIENDDNKIPAWLWDKIQATLAKARGES